MDDVGAGGAGVKARRFGSCVDVRQSDRAGEGSDQVGLGAESHATSQFAH